MTTTIGGATAVKVEHSRLGEDDPTSRRLIEQILEKEEEHAEDLVTLLARLPEEQKKPGFQRPFGGRAHWRCRDPDIEFDRRCRSRIGRTGEP